MRLVRFMILGAVTAVIGLQPVRAYENCSIYVGNAACQCQYQNHLEACGYTSNCVLVSMLAKNNCEGSGIESVRVKVSPGGKPIGGGSIGFHVNSDSSGNAPRSLKFGLRDFTVVP